MRKMTAEEPLILADCSIEDAQERIRRQKYQLLQMLAQVQDASLKIQVILLLTKFLRSMRRYRTGVLHEQKLDPSNDADQGNSQSAYVAK